MVTWCYNGANIVSGDTFKIEAAVQYLSSQNIQLETECRISGISSGVLWNQEEDEVEATISYGSFCSMNTTQCSLYTQSFRLYILFYFFHATHLRVLIKTDEKVL